jgi:hypothetical protein
MAKRPSIKYTNREFQSIKQELINYAKRYYPTTFQDFNEASFGSLMLDTVAYIGDVLSFYLDYQSNEQFLSTAVEYGNVIKLAQQFGYRHATTPTASGMVSFYAVIPADNFNQPDEDYAPILKRGSSVTSTAGGHFLLVEDVNFTEPGLETLVAQVEPSTGEPTHFARKAYGEVVSGKVKYKTVTLGEFKRFRKIDLESDDVAEIIEVTDEDGREYFEVPYLSQNVIYKAIANNDTNSKSAPFILKAFPAPRRFTLEADEETVYMRFGFGSEENLATDAVVDPSEIVLDLYGKNYRTDDTFDPMRLLKSDKMGVGPSNTVLSITYRENVAEEVNASVGTISGFGQKFIGFNTTNILDPTIRAVVVASLEVENEEAIVGDVAEPDAEEIRLRSINMFATQNRAVTKQDYIALTYAMDRSYGAIKRCNIVKDQDSFKNNLNMYILSEDEDGFLATTNSTIKENLKTWINQYRMINDTIDILDARIVNVGIDFEIVTSYEHNPFDVIEACLVNLRSKVLGAHYDISESIKTSEFYDVISNTPGVTDVLSLQFIQKKEPGYSQLSFNLDANTSPDGQFIIAPEDVIYEFKFPSLDIRGAAK